MFKHPKPTSHLPSPYNYQPIRLTLSRSSFLSTTSWLRSSCNASSSVCRTESLLSLSWSSAERAVVEASKRVLRDSFSVRIVSNWVVRVRCSSWRAALRLCSAFSDSVFWLMLRLTAKGRKREHASVYFIHCCHRCGQIDESIAFSDRQPYL